jgi:hypothetical protein
MTTPANLTFSQIETRCANRLRIPTSNTTEMTKLDAVINDVYRDIYDLKDWNFLIKRSVINTVAKYTTGTISVTNGSTAATLSTPSSTSLVGFVLYIVGDTTDSNALYRITADNLAGTLAFDAAFTGTTSTSATFKAYRDTYDAPTDCGKLIKPKRYGRDAGMEPIGLREMADLKTRDLSEGKPAVYAMLDHATTGDTTTARQFVVHPFPDTTYRLEIFYKQQLNTEMSGSTQPFIPDEFRQVLSYGTLALGYPIFLADTERGGYFNQLFNDRLKLMAANEPEYGDDRPQLTPRDVDRRRFPDRGRRRGRISLGSYFDRWPSDSAWP